VGRSVFAACHSGALFKTKEAALSYCRHVGESRRIACCRGDCPGLIAHLIDYATVLSSPQREAEVSRGLSYLSGIRGKFVPMEVAH
jgi:hypothetical protein